jgi:osmotically-inducible protein OsmY
MSDDVRLQSEVLEELRREPSVDAAHIGVTTSGGVVTLSGHVSSFAEKRAAAAAALRVRGAKAVADELLVRLPLEAERSDEILAAAVVERLAGNAFIPAGAVKAVVEDGFVTLSGVVEWHYQKEAADAEVSRLIGVTGLADEITLRSRVSATSISDDITHALHRSWFFDPTTITVSVDGGTVRLGGTVRTPHERQVAIATAWAEPGVTQVEDHIKIA